MASPISAAKLPALTWVTIGFLGLLAAGLIALLGPQWLHKPDLAHGLFTPLASLILLHEARRAALAGDRNALNAPGPLIAATLALGILSLAACGLYAAALEWSHPLVGFAAAVSFSLLLLAAAMGLSNNPGRLLALNWSSFLAAVVWVLSAPIPPGTYGRITLALQLWVSGNVLRVLHLFGIAAMQHGNVIELARTSVGVEEACSGVRSLVSCVFAGLFLSGFLVRRPWARAAIIVLSAPLAIAMNFIRSLVLTLLANSGVEIAGTWHNVTGYAILVVTAILLGAFALFLARGERAGARSTEKDHPLPPRAPGRRVLAGGLGLAVAMTLLLAFQAELTRAAPVTPPDLDALVPAEVPGWQVATATDLVRFKDTLETDRFIQRTYSRLSPTGGIQITLYLAYWAPGQINPSLVDTHTPDWCWPAGGWEIVPVPQTQALLASGSRYLPPAEYRRFVKEGYPQHVWFWHLYDGKPVPFIDPLSPVNLLRIATRYGFRRAGDQMFIRLSSNQSWESIAGDPLVAELFTRLKPYGL